MAYIFIFLAIGFSTFYLSCQFRLQFRQFSEELRELNHPGLSFSPAAAASKITTASKQLLPPYSTPKRLQAAPAQTEKPHKDPATSRVY